MVNLKEYFYNLNNYSDPEIKKFIYDFTDKFNPFLLIALNKEFVIFYLKEMEKKNEWKIKKDFELLANLVGEEDVLAGTNILCIFYSYVNSVFEVEEKLEHYENLSFLDHQEMRKKIYAFQFCMQEIIESHNSNAKPNDQDLVEDSRVENKENPFPLIFINFKVYNCFVEYAHKHVLEFYSDFSYLKKRLEDEKLIYYQKDNSFMEFVFNDVKLIKQKDFENYIGKHESKLKSLKKSFSEQRENNFNNVFEELLNSNKYKSP